MAPKPNTEFEMLDLLVSRNGQVTRVITMDGEPMKVRSVRQVIATPKVAIEFVRYAERGGLPASADDGRYFFYTNEVARIEDVESGEVIFDRNAA